MDRTPLTFIFGFLVVMTPVTSRADKLTVNLDPHLATRTRPWTRTVSIDTEHSPLYSTQPKIRWLQNAGAIPEGELGDHEVNLSFDDGPQPQKTVNILKILASAGLRVNFFMMGKNAFYFKNIAKKVAAAGHVIGSHSINHPIMRNPSPAYAREQIECGSYLVGKSTGLEVPFFRFPGGEINTVSYNALRDAHQAAFFWDVDSTDCHAESTPGMIYNQVMTQLATRPRGILLFHDVWAHTAVALPSIIEALYRNDFTIVLYEPRHARTSNVPGYEDAPPFCKKIVADLEEGRHYEYGHFGPDDRDSE
ncbi:polysaccharide deacetylase family protein [Bdellovibrionota bacterium FG-1]